MPELGMSGLPSMDVDGGAQGPASQATCRAWTLRGASGSSGGTGNLASDTRTWSRSPPEVRSFAGDDY